MPSSDAIVFNIFILRTQMSSQAKQVPESKPSAEQVRAECQKAARQVLDEYYTNVDGEGAVPYAVVVTQLVMCLTKGGLKPQPQALRTGQHNIELCGALPALPIEIVRGLWKLQTRRECSPVPESRAKATVPSPVLRNKNMRSANPHH